MYMAVDCFPDYYLTPPASGVTHIPPVLICTRFPVIWIWKPVCIPSIIFPISADRTQDSKKNSINAYTTALYNITDTFMSALSLHSIFPNVP